MLRLRLHSLRALVVLQYRPPTSFRSRAIAYNRALKFCSNSAKGGQESRLRIGRDVLDPIPIKKAAVAIVDYHRRSVPVGDCSNEGTVITAVDNDNAIGWRHLSAQALTTSGLSIVQQVKRPGISASADPGE